MKSVSLTLIMVLVGVFCATSCKYLPGGGVKASMSKPGLDSGVTDPGEGVATPQQINLRCLNQRVPVIMYHDIVERRGRGTVWFDCTVKEFRSQMDLIKSRGYQPVSLGDLYKHLSEGSPLPSRAIVLTFDDNYQGFYDNAWPLLKANNYPAAIFVHTGFVGRTTGRSHMSWETLESINKDPLITIASHTITHPDLTAVTPDVLTHELTDSKKDLESHLGKTVDFFAYPDGKNNSDDQRAAKDAGYTMSVSIVNGPAEESPNIQCVNRYIQTRLEKALDECESSMEGAVGIFLGPMKPGPVSYSEKDLKGKRLALVSGGTPASLTSSARESVLDFMHRSGAVAGINGTFFDMAAIESTDNKLVGPCLTADASVLLPDNESFRWPKIRNRPVVLWGPSNLAIVPYSPPLMNDEDVYKALMPDVTDLFLAGAWLVHDGQPRSKKDLLIFSSKDVEDPRRRAAFGVLKDGTPFAAAAKDSVSSSAFAEMLSQSDVQEAVLLDSGFSTSLVYGEKIMASGHSTKTEPSRPVPHAIVFKGDLDPASQTVASAAIPATDAMSIGSPAHHRRGKRTRSRRRLASRGASGSALSAAPGSGLP